MDFVRVVKEGGTSGRTLEPGSLAILYMNHDDLTFVYLEPGQILNNRFGAFHHDDVLGQQFGVVWKSRISRWRT